MQMQLDFWHSYWEEYQPMWKAICQNTIIIGRFRSADEWTRYSVFRFAFTYYNSTR